jgi:hypothetical protein
MPAARSEFESTALQFGLSPDQYENSAALRKWVLKNKNHKYVPPELLTAWDLEVD